MADVAAPSAFSDPRTTATWALIIAIGCFFLLLVAGMKLGDDRRPSPAPVVAPDAAPCCDGRCPCNKPPRRTGDVGAVK